MNKQICFCFDYSEMDLEQDVIEHGKSFTGKIKERKKQQGSEKE